MFEHEAERVRRLHRRGGVSRAREVHIAGARSAIIGGSNGGLLVGAVDDAAARSVRGRAAGSGRDGHAALPPVHRRRARGPPSTARRGLRATSRYLRAYSPLHNVKPGTCYPATLVTTADHDDRVVPSHSFKFAATMQAAQGCAQAGADPRRDAGLARLPADRQADRRDGGHLGLRGRPHGHADHAAGDSVAGGSPGGFMDEETFNPRAQEVSQALRHHRAARDRAGGGRRHRERGAERPGGAAGPRDAHDSRAARAASHRWRNRADRLRPASELMAARPHLSAVQVPPQTGTPMRAAHCSLALVLVALTSNAAGSVLRAQQPPAAAAGAPGTYDPATYEQSSADIAMRDGVKLHVEIFRPKGATEPLPFLLSRTPYGVGGSRGRLAGSYKDLAEDGYIFVFQDIRGRYKSEGTFVMQRPPQAGDAPAGASTRAPTPTTRSTGCWRTSPATTAESGCSASATMAGPTAMGMLGAHPALKAVSPQASPADMFLGDDFHHNGAFRLSYGFEYAGSPRRRARTPTSTSTATTPTSGISTSARFEHPGEGAQGQEAAHVDRFRRASELRRVLAAAGDAAVPHARHRADAQRRRLVGPGRLLRTGHDLPRAREARPGEPELPRRRSVAARRLGRRPGAEARQRSTSARPTGEYYRAKIQAPFFAYYLKDKGSLTQPEATVFESGSNTWRTLRSRGRRKNADDAARSTSSRRQALVHAADGDRAAVVRQLRERSRRIPVPYRPRPIEPTYYPEGLGLVHVAARGSALRAGPARRAELGDRAADRGCRRRRRDHGEAVRQHDGPGCRLGGEADRRLSRELRRPTSSSAATS